MKNDLLRFGRPKVSRATLCAAVAVAGIMLGTSCDKKELKPDEGHLLLNLNWQHLVPGESVPERMSVYIYGGDGSLRQGKSEGNRYEADLPTGKYQVLVFNGDTEGVAFTDAEEFDKAYARVLPVSNRADSIRQPGWLYSAAMEVVNVEKGEEVQRTLLPKPLTRRITLNIRLKGDCQAVTNLSATLTGVASSVGLVSGAYGDALASVTELDTWPTGEGYTANGLVFGLLDRHPDGTPVPRTVRLRLGFNNGGSQVIEKDIGSGVTGDPADIEINTALDIEAAATGEAGFTARMTKWEVKNLGVNVDNRPGGQPLP